MNAFLTVDFEPNALRDSGFGGRDEIEDPLDEALSEAGLGEVVGGGTGKYGSNIDIEIDDAEKIAEAITLIRSLLRTLETPRTTTITVRTPFQTVYPVY